MVQVLVPNSLRLVRPFTFQSTFQALLLSTLVIQICSEKYSDFQLDGEEGKYIIKSSTGGERLCHICPNDDPELCGRQGVNKECQFNNQNLKTGIPWCNCGPLVGCDPLPVFDNGTYRCWPFGRWKGTVYQTCVPECVAGFRLIQGNTGLRCGENRKWNETVEPPICHQQRQEVTAVPLDEAIKSSSPSVTRSDQRPINGTDEDKESSGALNPAVVGPIGVGGFVILFMIVVILCCKYNKRCQRCPPEKSPVITSNHLIHTTEVDLPEIDRGSDNNTDTREQIPDVPSSTTVSIHNSSYVDEGSDAGTLPSASSSTASAVDTRTHEESTDGESVPLLQEDPKKTALEKQMGGHDLPSSHGEGTLTSSSFPPLTSGMIPYPSHWSQTEKTPLTDGDQSVRKPLQPTDGSTPIAASPTKLNSNPDPGTGCSPLSDVDLYLRSCDSLTMTGDIIDQLGSRHEADGADSLYVDVPGQPSKQTNHYKDQDSEAPKTDVIRSISTPSSCPVRNQAAPAQTQGQPRSEADDTQTPCHLQSEADDHRIHGHHHRNTSADQLRTDVIGTDECVTFSDFQEKREAFEFFSRLDIILVPDTCDCKNWFGVSKWILTSYNMDHLVDYLNGLRVTIHDLPGNSYFNHVIRNEFVNKGVKLGQVLHFYAEKYSNYKIKKLFQKYHPECGYCQKFYDVKEK